MKSRDRKKSIANYFYFLFMPTKYSQIKVQHEDKDQIKSNATKVQPTGMDQNKDVFMAPFIKICEKIKKIPNRSYQPEKNKKVSRKIKCIPMHL